MNVLVRFHKYKHTAVFFTLLIDCGVLRILKNKYIDDYIDIQKDFEVKKREIQVDRPATVSFRLPSIIRELVKENKGQALAECIAESSYKDGVTLVSDKLNINLKIVLSLFETTVDSITSHLQKLLLSPELKDCSTIVMVGGFSESSVLQDRVRRRFSDHIVIIPTDAGVAVLKGAVMFGHDPKAIAQRILKYTYGQKVSHVFTDVCLKTHPRATRECDEDGVMRCINVFSVHARAGDAVTMDQMQPERVYKPVSYSQRHIISPVLVSTDADPQVSDDCIEIGKLVIPVTYTTKSKDARFGVSFMFGKTEVKVKVVNKSSGEKTTLNVDCLEHCL